MPDFSFDPADYLEEVSDERLEEELRERGSPIPVKVEDIRDALLKAWRKRDEAEFLAALAMLEPADVSRGRLARIEQLYREQMNGRQLYATARHSRTEERGCGSKRRG